MTSQAPGRRGPYYGWVVVIAAVFGITGSVGLPVNCMSLFLKGWSDEFHTPISQILVMTVPMAMGIGLSSAFIGPIADRRPARWLVGLGLGGMALAQLLVSFTTEAWQLEAVYGLLMAIPTVLSTQPVINPLVSRWFVKRLGVALGIAGLGIGLAGVLLPPLISEVLPQLGWRNVWRISAAVLGLLIMPVVVFLVRDRPTEREGLDYVQAPAGPAAAGHGHGPGHGVAMVKTLDILKRRNFWIALAVLGTIGGVNTGGVYNVAPLVQSHGFDQRAAGVMLSLASFSQVAAALGMGLVCDRFGARMGLLVLSIVGAAGTLLLGFGSTLPVLTAGMILMGCCGGVWIVMPAAAATEFGAGSVGRVFGLFVLIVPVHGLVGSVIARAKEMTGSYAGVMSGLAALSAIVAVMVLFFMRGGATPAARSTARDAPALRAAPEPLA